MLLQINWFPIGHNTAVYWLSHYVPNVLQVSGFKSFAVPVPLHISFYADTVDYEAS
jgi:hypothetical protein